MLVSDQHIEEYIQTGASIVDGLLPPEIIDGAAKAMDELYASSEDQTGIKGYISDPGFVNLFQHPNLEAAAKRILGCDAVHMLSSATLHTEPDGNPWSYNPDSEHVDIQYTAKDWLQTPRQIIITFMIFLDDITEDRAPTLVRPGSHLQIAEYNGEEAYQENPVFLRDLPDLDYADPVPLCGKKGQVAVSTTALVHAGSSNASDKPRKMLFAVFAATEINPPFNAPRIDKRIAWLEDLERKFDPDRRHLASSPLPELRRYLKEEQPELADALY